MQLQTVEKILSCLVFARHWRGPTRALGSTLERNQALAAPTIPNIIRRKKRFRWTKALYRERNRVERFFNKLKQFRRIATRYDKLGASFMAFIQLAAVRISLRLIESTP